MTSLFSHADARDAFRHARRELHDQWRHELADRDALAELPLRPAADAAPATGSQPQVVLEDDRGRRYLFKLAPPDQIAAEVFAGRVRELGRQPHAPAVRRTLVIDGRECVGLLQPRLAIAGTLPRDPLAWTGIQRESILRDHPWEWLVGNLDTHIDQYVLVGDHGLPLNIDWDHALLDLAADRPTRFDRRSLTVVPVHNHLYAAYVAGRLELDLFGLRIEAHRIAALSFSTIAELAAEWAGQAGVPAESRALVLEQLRRRHAEIAARFDTFVDDLDVERGHAGARPPWTTRSVARLRDAWQRFVLLVVHDHVVRPVLRARRWIVRTAATLGT